MMESSVLSLQSSVRAIEPEPLTLENSQTAAVGQGPHFAEEVGGRAPDRV